MSRRLLNTAVAMMFLPVVTLHAQIGFGASAGPTAALGDFSNAVETGYHVTGLVTIGLPLLPVGGRLEGSFNQFNYKASTRDAKARILSATANAVFSMPGIIGPYLIGGVGMYRATAECSSCTTSNTRGGVNGGAGLKIGLAGFSAFVEARYHYIGGASDPTNGGVKGSSTQFIPLSFGLTF